MSTKGSLKYKQDSFHLYEECMDLSGAVYLNLTDPVFEIERIENGKPEVTVCIPRDVWNEIIKVGEREKGEDFFAKWPPCPKCGLYKGFNCKCGD